MEKISHNQKGFTLVETLIAIFILTVAVVGLMTVAKNDFYVVKYARSQMIATALMQEGLEYVRADRDTASESSTWNWTDWLKKYTDAHCDTTGCYVDPYATIQKVAPCSGACPNIVYFPDTAFYAYSGDVAGSSYASDFIRKIQFAVSIDDPNQLTVTSTISWHNGTASVTQSQSTLLTNWMAQ